MQSRLIQALFDFSSTSRFTIEGLAADISYHFNLDIVKRIEVNHPPLKWRVIDDYLNFKPEVLLILLKSQEYTILADFLIQDLIPSALVLQRLKSFATIA